MAGTDQPNEGELILYQTQEGAVRGAVRHEAETFWLNQKKIAELFGVDLRTVSEHLNEVYDSGELSREATLRKTWKVQKEGNRDVRRAIEFYNLDAIISVGYRVNSSQATRFRICHHQGLRTRRRAAQAQQTVRHGRLRRTAGTHPGGVTTARAI